MVITNGSVMINDIMAFVFGKTMGRTPLIKLSPNKTVEGFVGGGLSTCVFAIWVSEFWFLTSLDLWVHLTISLDHMFTTITHTRAFWEARMWNSINLHSSRVWHFLNENQLGSSLNPCRSHCSVRRCDCAIRWLFRLRPEERFKNQGLLRQHSRPRRVCRQIWLPYRVQFLRFHLFNPSRVQDYLQHGKNFRLHQRLGRGGQIDNLPKTSLNVW